MRKVLVFGTFDGVHDGHRAFFRQAKEHGDHLIVAVAQDDIVRQLKHHAPEHDLDERMAALHEEDLIDMVIAGDAELGTYRVVKTHDPQVIALGYDQKELRSDIELYLQDLDHRITLVVLVPHEPEKYHNRLLKDEKK